MADIFISYSKQQPQPTRDVAAFLASEGYSAWWDTNLTAGEDFREVINRELDAAKAVIVIWTTHAVKSEWVLAEADRAARGSKLIPLRTSDLDTQYIPMPYGRYHTELVDNREAILRAVRRLAGDAMRAQASPPQPTKPVEPQPWLSSVLPQHLNVEPWARLDDGMDLGLAPTPEKRSSGNAVKELRSRLAAAPSDQTPEPPLARTKTPVFPLATRLIGLVVLAVGAVLGLLWLASPHPVILEHVDQSKPAATPPAPLPVPAGSIEAERGAETPITPVATLTPAERERDEKPAGSLPSAQATAAPQAIAPAPLPWPAPEPPKPAAAQQTAAVAPPVRPAVPANGPCDGPVTVSFPSRCAAPLTAAQERGLQPKDSFRECEKCPEMVVVPRSSFTMGSAEDEKGRNPDEGPQHVVRIPRAFAVGKLHVTVGQFAAFVAETGYDTGSKCWTFEGGKAGERSGRSWRNPGFAQEGSHPAFCLNWNDAKAYVEWAAKKTGKAYRMLTEAEWEYAARGRTAPGAYPRFWFGDDEKDLCRYGNGADQKLRDTIEGAKNFAVAPCDDGYAYTSPAGHFAANAFGLRDMFGNAWQWTADCYRDSYKGAPSDGSMWTAEDCNDRVIRGGSWFSFPGHLRPARRDKIRAENRNVYVGFRLARTLISAESSR